MWEFDIFNLVAVFIHTVIANFRLLLLFWLHLHAQFCFYRNLQNRQRQKLSRFNFVTFPWEKRWGLRRHYYFFCTISSSRNTSQIKVQDLLDSQRL